MSLQPSRVAILGATGPTGIHLAKTLRGTVSAIRVVSRSEENLRRSFSKPDGSTELELLAADVLDESAARRAVAGCELVFDCIGLPPSLMDRHADVARNVARAAGDARARIVQVSSYWSYLPVIELPLDETHPRKGGSPWIEARRAAEDVFQAAGAAVVQLPDFYGPHVHSSTLQNALNDAVAGRAMRWIGSGAVERDYVYVPDAMKWTRELARHEEAYGERFLFPGAGALSAQRLAELLRPILDREVSVRAAPPWLLKIVSWFNADLRGFMQMVPHYARRITFDTSKLEKLIGALDITSYADGLAETISWIRKRRDS